MQLQSVELQTALNTDNIKMSDLLDDLYLSPDEDAQEESSFPQNYEEKIVENTENFEDTKEEEETNSTQAPEDESVDDETFLSTSSLDKFNESFQKEAEYWRHVSDSLDEEEYEKEVTDILNKEKFKLFNESFEKQAEDWRTLSESVDDESFEKHIELNILQKPFEVFLQNDLELFESLFQNGDNFWNKVKDCLTEGEFEKLVKVYIESEDITWKRLTTEAFESFTKPRQAEKKDIAKVSVEAKPPTEDKSVDDTIVETKDVQERKSKNHRDEKKEKSPKRERSYDAPEEPKKKKLNNSSSSLVTNSANMKLIDMFEKETHRCRKCPAVFKSLKELKTHSPVHDKVVDVKPFICDLCPKSFKVSNQLKLHKEFNHSVNKPLTCNFCQRPFKQFDVLQKHRRRHYA